MFIEKIQPNNPFDIKSLSYKDLDVFAKEIREEILRNTSLYGGHLSSNLGTVELTLALYRSFDFPRDKLLFDVGHQSYTHKILTGRSLQGLGDMEKGSRFCDTKESIFDPADAGHSSTSLSLAEGFALSRDLKGEWYDVLSVIGDASIANGLAFEALNSIGSSNTKVIVVLNDNDMSISAPSGALSQFFRKISTDKLYNKAKVSYRKALTKSKIGRSFYGFSYFIKNQIKRAFVPITLFETLGFTYIGPIDGHDVKTMEKAFARAKNATKPTLVHVLTKKGKGYRLSEEDKDGSFHSVSPFLLETGEKREKKENEISFPAFFGNLVYEKMRKDDKTILIAAAMVKGSALEKAFSSFPNRCFDVGIAEEHAVTLASAFALNGYHPIVSLYSTFLQRSYDELLHDCARKEIEMTLLIDRAGLPGKDGETHAGIYDVAFLKTIPNVSIFMPKDFSEAKALFLDSFEKGKGLFAIRYPNASLPLLEEREVVLQKGYSVLQESHQKENSSLLLTVSSSGLFLAKEVKGIFQGEILSCFQLHPIPPSLLMEIKKFKTLYVYDPSGTEKGFVEALKAALFDHDIRIDTYFFTLPNAFIPHGRKEEQEALFGLDPKTVKEKILLLEKRLPKDAKIRP